MDHKQTGNIGEDLAVDFLLENGYEIIERNFRYSNYGELDIIAEKDNILVFVEVKTDRTGSFGPPEYWVGARKQKQVIRIAQYFLMKRNFFDRDCRFDVIGITIRGNKSTINHIENAFMT